MTEEHLIQIFFKIMSTAIKPDINREKDTVMTLRTGGSDTPGRPAYKLLF